MLILKREDRANDLIRVLKEELFYLRIFNKEVASDDVAKTKVNAISQKAVIIEKRNLRKEKSLNVFSRKKLQTF